MAFRRDLVGLGLGFGEPASFGGFDRPAVVGSTGGRLSAASLTPASVMTGTDSRSPTGGGDGWPVDLGGRARFTGFAASGDATCEATLTFTAVSSAGSWTADAGGGGSTGTEVIAVRARNHAGESSAWS